MRSPLVSVVTKLEFPCNKFGFTKLRVFQSPVPPYTKTFLLIWFSKLKRLLNSPIWLFWVKIIFFSGSSSRKRISSFFVAKRADPCSSPYLYVPVSVTLKYSKKAIRNPPIPTNKEAGVNWKSIQDLSLRWSLIQLSFPSPNTSVTESVSGANSHNFKSQWKR